MLELNLIVEFAVPDDLLPVPYDDVVPKHASRAPRPSVMLVATIVQTGRGLITKHRVRDLSSGGLQVDNAAGMESGATVMISVGAVEADAATVKWVRDGLAGLAFETPIDPEDARQKAAIAPSSAAKPKAINANANPGAKAGWVEELQNPYRK